MNVEEMVALMEQRLPPEGGFEMVQFSDYEMRTLIASWRRQRKVLRQLQQTLPDEARDYGFRGRINDALKDTP